jgi:pimeloyl-ACP methyl ester carboxylesterase
MTTIVTIHGHGSSPESFNYIKEFLEGFNIVDLSYDSSYGFESNLLALSEKLSQIDDKIIFIGHSLGGIYCAHLALLFPEKTFGGATLATPWGGCFAGLFLRFIWPARVFKDITPTSLPICTLLNKTLPGKWFSVVTTKGYNKWLLGDNDGVVSKVSMMTRTDVEYIESDTGHIGVLLSSKVVQQIKGALLAIEIMSGKLCV